MLQNPSSATTIQPKVVVIRRRPNQGFGFTLRHFIAYPPEDDPSWPQEPSEPYHPQLQVKAMETIFIKEVQPNGPAHHANLQTGDRVLMVNNTPIAGIAYSTIVSMIKQTPAVLTLHVVPKECDVLQMHYTTIAHTPETNRVTVTSPPVKPLNPTVATATTILSNAPTVGNGNVAGALIPFSVANARTFPHQQQLISYSAGSRSGSITSTTSSNLRPSAAANNGSLIGIEFGDMAAQHAGALLMRGDVGGLARSQQSGSAILSSRQQQQQLQQIQQQHQHQQNQQQNHHYQQQQTNAYYAHNIAGVTANAADTSDLMVRLRESIKQKEEFLKSPLPHATSHSASSAYSNQQQQHFFPHTPPSGSPQLSTISTSTVSVGSSSGVAVAPVVARGQVRTIAKQPISAVSSSSGTSSTRELLPMNYDIQGSYSRNLSGNYSLEGPICREIVGLPTADIQRPTVFTTMTNSQQQQQQHQQRQLYGNNASSSYSGLVSSLRDKYSKELDYYETLQETGVTNKVFERKLVSHMSKGFDPFKPLSININAIESGNTVTPANAGMIRKPGVLYESLQNHPLHQQMQLQQTTTTKASNNAPLPGRAYAANTASASASNQSVIDGQCVSRMEVHKASLAAATSSDQTPSKYTNKFPLDGEEQKPKPTTKTLADIAEASISNDTKSAKASSDGVVRRFRAAASLDDGKPMRRISYLRATNNEHEYQTIPGEAYSTPNLAPNLAATTSTPTSATSTTTRAATTTTISTPTAASAILEASSKRHVEDESEPTYDVVAGDYDILESHGALDVAAKSAATTATVCALGTTNSRRTSLTSDMRKSIHLDNIASEMNGKAESKDVTSEMEIFETEMEIKSTCINGKRMSEYRSWKQVKIEIKGDILKIYPCRSSKSDNNVIEIDIRNFKMFDESVDKKKYVFRMQSKPTAHIATLGNEMNLDDVPTEKSTASTNSSSHTTASSTGLIQGDHPQQLQQQPHTEILFKAKSMTEMRRIFGLLQWKNSLNYDDSDLHGKQLAEPQKTAATTSMPTATYCDDIVQQQQQQQQLHPPDYSPISSTSRGDLEITESISPVMKTRKSASHKNIPEKDLGSPKAKNWKDLIFRRGGGGSSGGGSHSSADVSPSNLTSNAKTTGSIGVPLKSCPMSKNNEYVPNIVEVCTNIVETKGLGVVGIYRIPGNKAAISELSDQVNKNDFSWDRCNTDVRWEDVNVVSSLLKLFIRSLPDALLPSSFYINFIEADKKTGLVRLKELKHLLESLPRYSYETMKHLIRHLNRVSKNCEVNLMEPKNLAIIFGPSIIRTPNDTLEIAVKDMKHQCRIVEILVSHYDYFFENGTTPDIADISGNVVPAVNSEMGNAAAQAQEDQTNMLLHNVSKIERFTEREVTRTSRFIPQLRRRTHSKRSAVSSDTYSGESVLSLDYNNKSAHNAGSSSGSSTNATMTSSSCSSNFSKKEHFISSVVRTHGHGRKASLDEKDSGSGSGSGGSLAKEQQRSSVDISILLTDDESSNSRNSDTGSMSLNAVTDTLDSKLRNLRSGSESNDEENGSPDFPKNRRHTFGQPLHLHSENIPYADESPERHFHNVHPLDVVVAMPLNALSVSRSCTTANTVGGGGVGGGVARLAHEFTEREKEQQRALASSGTGLIYKSHKLQHSATAPITTGTANNVSNNAGIISPPLAATPTLKSTTNAGTAVVTGMANSGSARNSYTGKNIRFSSSVYEQCCSEDDSEGSTTSDPKESLVITSPSFFLDRYNKKRRDHRLFRSASFNCRNYTTRHSSQTQGSPAGSCAPALSNTNAALTKDEKTDMNLTKKRQIQNKQNRSIKRRHTVGGPHDYSSNGVGSNCNHHCKGKEKTAAAATTTTVLRRMPLSSANGNIANNNNNNNNSSSPQQSDGSSSNGNSSGASGENASTTVAVTGGEHVLEVGIRIKNINRGRF